MKISSSTLFMGMALMATIFVSCESDDDTENPTDQPAGNELILINSAYTDQGQMLVNLYAADSLESEYTKLFIEVKDSASNNTITDAIIDINPMMDMGTMMHSAPAENPISNTAVDGMFEGAVVFIMPGEMGWTVEVTVFDPVNDTGGMAVIPVSVAQPVQNRTSVITPLDGSSSLVISYINPQNPKVGVNDFEISIHRRESMMLFVPVDDLTVEIEPEMPSMGHGSPNNVNPTIDANGHYKGQVNFTMTGLWRINLDISNNTTPLDSTSYFEITF